MGLQDRDWWRDEQRRRQAVENRRTAAPARSLGSTMRRSTLGIVLFWLVVMAGLYAVMKQVEKPRAAVVSAQGELIIPRGKDGHFRVAGSVNGKSVNFMVDTGASLVAVSDALAQSAGLQEGKPARFQTANGTRVGRIASGALVGVGSFKVKEVRVGVGISGADPQDALLGQNFLKHFDVQMLRDEMILKLRTDAPT